jgi:MFS family permease
MVAQSLFGAAAIYLLKANVLPTLGYEGVYGALTVYTLLGLVALGIYYMTVNGFTGFAERLGEHFGVRSGLIASALAVGVLLSTMGSAFVAVAGDRWGRVRPILVAAVMALTGYGMLLGAPGEGPYFAAILLINLSFGVIIAYAYAIIAAADPSGRFIGIATAAAGIGIAITMTLMGRIIATYGYPTFNATLIGITVIALSLMVGVAARVPRKRAP